MNNNFSFQKNVLVYILGTVMFLGCHQKNQEDLSYFKIEKIPTTEKTNALFEINIEKDVSVDEYFDFIKNLVVTYDSLVPYDLTTYLLVHNNDWLIDTFAHTDYYYQISKGNFIYDQPAQIVLKKGTTLFVPNELKAKEIGDRINSFSIDINIPEFKLNILEKDSIIHTFPVRVGQTGERFMSTVDRVVKMKTKTGSGKIASINTNPRWENPVDGHRYHTTLRDDKKRTMVPRIPFLHPEINGKRWGQLIHPTTNPKTLGKAYSNGCIGTAEGDAWRIYFHAPIGTPVKIRYDLKVEKDGKMILLKDIYHRVSP